MHIKNTIKQQHNKMTIIMPIVIIVLIILGMKNMFFSFLALLGCAVYMILSDETEYIMFLFFLMPIAQIFKMSPNGTSFFTFIELLFVIFHFIKTKGSISYEQVLSILLVLYVIICECIALSVDALRTIKFFLNLILLTIFLEPEIQKNSDNIFIYYILGFIVSGLIGQFGSLYFPVNQYVGTIIERTINGEITRYAGLYTDPNYFSVNLIICACLSVFLYHRKRICLAVFLAFIGFIVYFIGNTNSKSALLMLALPVFSYTWLQIKNRKAFGLIISCILLAIGIYLISLGRISLFNNVIGRINAVYNKGIDRLTTGRYKIWLDYLDYFMNNAQFLLIGKGVGIYLLDGKAAHNTYIDLLYQLGLIGSVIYIRILVSILKCNRMTHRRNLTNYSICICITVMYFFLSQLQSIDLPFQLALAILCINLDLNKQQYEEKDQKIYGRGQFSEYKYLTKY